MQWLLPIIPVLRRLRLEDCHKFQANLKHKVSCRLTWVAGSPPSQASEHTPSIKNRIRKLRKQLMNHWKIVLNSQFIHNSFSNILLKHIIAYVYCFFIFIYHYLTKHPKMLQTLTLVSSNLPACILPLLRSCVFGSHAHFRGWFYMLSCDLVTHSTNTS